MQMQTSKPTANVAPEYLRLEGTSQFTGLSKPMILKLAREGRIARVRVGRAVCFPVAALREFMQSCAV